MFPIVLAGLSALAFGTSDFSGGKASQRANPLTVTVISQLLGLPVLAVALLVVPGTPHLADLGWGLVAGTAGFGGVVLLYRALASGAMAVVAPVTAVTAALIPIIAGLFTPRTPGALALAGAAVAVLAIALVSVGPRTGRVSPRLVALALTAGALFGFFFALLGQASETAGLWPLLTVRISSIGLGVAVMLATRTAFRTPRTVLPWAAAAGMLDMAANALFLAAATRGHLSVVAAITALYPASTVLLALAVDRERLRPLQIAGLGLAATALVLATT
ncbi:EamA-like transporter family protein [Micromonospora pattaloongensis]|uniref:EamA-like transporter family protein n=1 Tax=Micromonospora pattaloongensis TaxID=405436 RepID=A0A1H3TA93_9ACTN|nr:DMT family transporter [Micromonospora pattaloongensis]SDZ46788.1 EamA-like transporter family protein [Micromonospora pattaloongensis]